jgi:bifunctional hydroxylase/dehydrase
MKNHDADVIIVGAGPTGLMLAGELRLSGISTIVVDRLAEPTKQSRALGFSARTIEEFGQRGLLPRFGDLQTIPIGHFGGLPIDYRVLPAGSYGARGIPQSVTEAVLAGWATGLGAVVRRRTEVTALAPGDDGVSVTVTTPDGEQQLSARYLAGCDGGRSTVRKLAGIGFPGTEPVIEMWFADVAGCGLRPRFSGERVPGGNVMVLPMGPDTSRVILYERGAMQRRGDGAPSFAEIAAAWQRLTGEDISGGTPLWTSYVTDSSRQAAAYRQGPVFLLGDAAHVHLPIGAQGMSAGIGDAVNLGWKLAAAVRGDAPDGLLDTYHTERHPVGARILANTLAQRFLYLGGDEMDPMREVLTELLADVEAQRHLAGMVTGLDIRYDAGPGDHPLLGRRLPNADLAGADLAGADLAGADLTGGSGPPGTVTAFELLQAGRGVLLDLSGDEGGQEGTAQAAAARSVAAPWATRVDVITAACPAAGPLAGVGAALVRPDGYTAWISSPGSGTAGLADALTRWFGPPGTEREYAVPAAASSTSRL